MSVISDAIDSLETWCSNLFKDGIKSQFDGISNLLTDTFSTTTGDSGLVNTLILPRTLQILRAVQLPELQSGHRLKHSATMLSCQSVALF